jgi:hypothetical protein
VRFIALDVHRDFCEVAISEDGKIRSHPRIPTDVEHLQVFARSLAPDDHVCLEVTATRWRSSASSSLVWSGSCLPTPKQWGR